MKERLKHRWLGILLCLTAVPCLARDPSGALVSNFPVPPVFVGPIGIVFPGTSAAVAVNPATLAGRSESWELHFANSMPTDNQDLGATATLVRTGKFFAAGAGYTGTAGSFISNGYFAGAGARLERLAVGISALQAPNASSPQVGAGATITVGKLVVATKFENVTASGNLAAGLGYRGRTTLFEVDFRSAPFANPSADSEVVSAGSVSFGKTNAYLAGDYLTKSKKLGYSLGVGRFINQTTHLSVMYSSTNRVTIGVSIQF